MVPQHLSHADGPDDGSLLSRLNTIDQVVGYAQRTLSPQAHLWAMAAAGIGRTRDRNAEMLRRVGLVPELMRDVSEVKTETTMAGVDLSFPVFASPVGSTSLYADHGSIAVAEAARRMGTTAVCGFMCEQPWAEVAATDPGRQLFQLYVLGDDDWLGTIVDRVERAGFAGICLTVDSARASRRDSLLESNLDWRLEREDVTVNLQGLGRDESWRPKFTWSHLEDLCANTRLPVLVKGILTGRDAARAMENGAAGVYVSNHGGRALDQEPSTIEVLTDVVSALDPGTEVVIDGGFTRGVEVCAALALGARAVGIGRLQLWGLAAGGADGLAHVFDILSKEFRSALALLGATSVDDLGPEHVRWLLPPT